ncbi:unnamed protein product [Strongylus vulgaris]|uniref:SCP domain-containing protein n=1 Tax=Strongylus vulgaris TaxID=40348 RepID=A0A3P7JBR9_STRVU|nr:unnamed protein product [Strongylus vulgaris]
MLKMVYDCTIEANALKHANICVYEHSKNEAQPAFGENLYRTTFSGLNKAIAAYQASYLWWRELRDYGVGPSNNFTLALVHRPEKDIAHYAQMAWDTSYKLGCAVVACPNFTYGVCQYGPSGNWIDNLIYTIGNPCSGCPKSYTCNVTEGLCEKK